MIRRLFYAASALVVIWAAFVVPMPFVELVPGGATPVTDLVEIEGTTLTEINGSLELLTIRVSTPSFVDSVQAWLAPQRELQRRDQVIPPSIDESEYFRLQRQQFEQAFEVAAAVGLREAGYEVEITSRPVVFSVLPGGPSAGILEAGDRILAVDGEEVTSFEDLADRLQGAEYGETIPLTVKRGNETLEVEVEAGQVPELDRPGIGVLIQTLASDIELPLDVQLENPSRIGGPSAGMMVALTVYDLVSDVDLARGRRIAGTGTIDASGNIGPIGGIHEKVFAALQADADLLLVPASQLTAAREVAPKGFELVGVATLEEAIAALRNG